MRGRQQFPLLLLLLSGGWGESKPSPSTSSSSSSSSLASSSSSSSSSGFGKGMLRAFTMDPQYVNLNHGSYGCVPKFVLAAQSRWREVTEANPDLFFRYSVFDDLLTARSAVAKYVYACEGS